MKHLEWKDEVRNGRVVTSDLKLKFYEISVNICPAKLWYVSCYGTVQLKDEELKASTLEDAKTEAVCFVAALINRMNNEMVLTVGQRYDRMKS